MMKKLMKEWEEKGIEEKESRKSKRKKREGRKREILTKKVNDFEMNSSSQSFWLIKSILWSTFPEFLTCIKGYVSCSDETVLKIGEKKGGNSHSFYWSNPFQRN